MVSNTTVRWGYKLQELQPDLYTYIVGGTTSYEVSQVTLIICLFPLISKQHVSIFQIKFGIISGCLLFQLKGFVPCLPRLSSVA